MVQVGDSSLAPGDRTQSSKEGGKGLEAVRRQS